MDFFASVANARQALEQAGADHSQQAKPILENPGRAAEDSKRVADDVTKGVSQAAANFDLGKTAEDVGHAADEAVQHVDKAVANIDLGGAAFGIQDSLAATIKTINQGFSSINIEQILTNAQIDAEKIANEVSTNIDLPGAVQSANQWVENGLTLTQQRLSTSDLGHTVDDAKLWVEAHPIETALLVANMLLILAPQLLTGPLLALAHMLQHGKLALARFLWGGVFAGLQSAGAAGYGLSIVNGIVQGGAGIATVVVLAIAAAEAERKPSKLD